MRRVTTALSALVAFAAIGAPTAAGRESVRRISVPIPAAGSITIVELKLTTKPKKGQKRIPLPWLKAKNAGTSIVAGVDRTKTKGVFNAVVLVRPADVAARRGAAKGGAKNAVLETTSAQTNITAREFADVPLNGRNFADLTLLAPQTVGRTFDREGTVAGAPFPPNLGGVEEALIESVSLSSVDDPTHAVIDVVTRRGMSEWVGGIGCFAGLEPFTGLNGVRRVDVGVACTRNEPGPISVLGYDLEDTFRIIRPLADPPGAQFYDIDGSSILWSFGPLPATLETPLFASFEISPGDAVPDGVVGVGFRTPTAFAADVFDIQVGKLAR